MTGREFTDTDLDNLAWYWLASKNNPIRSGNFCHRAEFPHYCRWCGTELVVRRTVVLCLRCDL